jgi:hydroxymethylpyrimidine pyrophosphatase-like HAD family hydrolase
MLGAWDPPDAFSVTQAISFCVELIPLGQNKGTAVSALLEYLNALPGAERIGPENVIVFGDGENDIPMFKAAGMSVAMGNAMPEAKAVARWQTSTNDKGGVGEFLERVFWSTL